MTASGFTSLMIAVQRSQGSQRRRPAERRPRPRVEEVARDLPSPQLAEGKGQVEPVVPGLPHPEDAAAAQLHAGGHGPAAGRLAVLEAVGGADPGEESGTGLEVVVVAVDAGGGELLRLAVPEQPERGRHLDLDLGADGAGRLADLLEQMPVRPPDG